MTKENRENQPNEHSRTVLALDRLVGLLRESRDSEETMSHFWRNSALRVCLAPMSWEWNDSARCGKCDLCLFYFHEKTLRATRLEELVGELLDCEERLAAQVGIHSAQQAKNRAILEIRNILNKPAFNIDRK